MLSPPAEVPYKRLPECVLLAVRDNDLDVVRFGAKEVVEELIDNGGGECRAAPGEENNQTYHEEVLHSRYLRLVTRHPIKRDRATEEILLMRICRQLQRSFFPPLDEVNSPYLVPQSSLSLSISRFALSADDGKQMD